MLRFKTEKLIVRAKPTPIIYIKDRREFFRVNKNFFVFIDKIPIRDITPEEQIIVNSIKMFKEKKPKLFQKFINNLPEKSDNDIGILRIHWLTTLKCNLKCKHCYNSSSPNANYNEILLPEDVLKFANKYGSLEITLSGGEPFVYPHIKKALEMFLEANLSILIFTNGTILPKWFTKLYEQSNDIGVYISIDGPPIHHDYIRGKGNFKQSFKNFETLYRISPHRVVINTVATSHNINNLKDWILYLIDKYSEIKIQIGRFLPTGRGKSNRNLIVEPKKFYETFYQLKEILGERLTLDEISTVSIRRKSWLKCSGGISKVTIDPKGDIYPCPLIRHRALKMGNIKSNFQKSKISKFENLLNSRSNCSSNCNYFLSCNTCVGVAYTFCSSVGPHMLEVELNGLL